jgi:hypothetical protein
MLKFQMKVSSMGIHAHGRREGSGLCTMIKVCLRLFANWNRVHVTLTFLHSPRSINTNAIHSIRLLRY